MSKLHRFLNWPNKVHKYIPHPDNPYLANCEYCNGVFIVADSDRIPFGIGAKLPDLNCDRSKL